MHVMYGVIMQGAEQCEHLGAAGVEFSLDGFGEGFGGMQCVVFDVVQEILRKQIGPMLLVGVAIRQERGESIVCQNAALQIQRM